MPYLRMAQDNELPWPTLEQLTTTVATFLDPVLAGHRGAWAPERWSWE